MSYYIDLFSPATYSAFSASSRTVSGFRKRQWAWAQKVQPGDKLVCYVTKVSRFVGILEVVEGPFEDDAPIFAPENDPFTTRFEVRPLIWLTPDEGLPIHDDRVWNELSFTRGKSKKSPEWTGRVRASLTSWIEADGKLLERLLSEQLEGGSFAPLTDSEKRRFQTHWVRREEGAVPVSVPEDSVDEEAVSTNVELEVRESIQIQAALAGLGAQMGLRIWLPRQDRSRVARVWDDEHRQLLETLPLNYDAATLTTIEQM